MLKEKQSIFPLLKSIIEDLITVPVFSVIVERISPLVIVN